MKNKLVGFFGIILALVGLWGGTWLWYNVSPEYQFAAYLTAFSCVVGGCFLALYLLGE